MLTVKGLPPASSLDLAGGAIQTPGGEVLLRASGQADSAEQYEDILVMATEDGTRITLGQIATLSLIHI